MRIMFLTDQIFLHGGVEKVLSQKANWLADIFGDEVFIVTYSQQGKAPVYDFSKKITMLDLGINYEVGLSYFNLKNLQKIPRHRRKLHKSLQAIKPDVVVSCSYGPDFYFMNSIEKQIPKIKEFHSSRFLVYRRKPSFKENIMRKLSENVERKFSAIAVLNQDEKEFYNNDNIVVIPNPSEKNSFTANIHSKKILAAGRISPVKNFSELIDVFAKISKDFPDWELHFYGEDYVGTLAKLQQKAKELQLENSIKFMGVSSDMGKTMLDYSIYAMTSETECFPMVLLEALSVGIPVVTYDSPTGPKHIVTNNSDSFLIPYKETGEFSNKVSVLMADVSLRKQMSANAIENVNRFEISSVMKQWRNLFLSLANV